jgi:hypothetical protein
MEGYQEYQEQTPLGENQYMLKISAGVGFLSKLNKDGSIPKRFDDWRMRGYGAEAKRIPIYLHTENFEENWKLVENYPCRIGQSQQWVILKHPKGFTVEIYLDNFMEILKNITIEKGVLQGKFKWQDNKLIAE